MIGRLAVATLLVVTLAGNLAYGQAAKKGPNGGLLILTPQGHPVELTDNGSEIAFYVDDDDGMPFPAKNLVRGPCNCSGWRQDHEYCPDFRAAK